MKNLIKEVIEQQIKEMLTGEVNTIPSEENNQLGSKYVGQYVIIRGYDSGVHFGKLSFASKGLYRLENSRRLWRWWAKQGVGLTSVATYGLADRDEVKLCVEIPEIEITDERICELIPCTDEVIKQIKQYKEFNPS